MFLGLLVAGGGVGSACKDPTEMMVRVTTDFPCSLLSNNEVGIRFGAGLSAEGPASSTSIACDNDYVGTVVITPGSESGRITIDVMAALSPATLDSDGTCVEGSTGCIHARRSLTYLDSTALTVPITLQQVCAGISCDPASTCYSAQCVSDSIDSNQCKTNCSLPAASTSTDAGTDGSSNVDGGPSIDPCSGSPGLQVGAPWPMNGYCAGNSSVSNILAPTSAPIKLSHAIQLGAAPEELVLGASQDAYVVTDDGMLHAFSLTTGTDIWTAQQLPSFSHGTIALASNDVLYVGTGSSIIAFKTSDGSMVAGPQPANITSSLLIGPPYLFGPSYVYCATNGGVVSFDFTSLAPVATNTSFGAISTNLVLFGDSVYAGTGSDLLTLDATTLAVTRSASVIPADNFHSIAIGTDGQLRGAYVDGANNVTAAAINLQTDSIVWHTPAMGSSAPPALVGSTSSFTFLTTSAASLQLFDPSGKPGLIDIPGGVQRPAIDAAGNVVTVDGSGSLVEYDASGTVKWTVPASLTNPVGVYLAGSGVVVVATSNTNASYLDVYTPP